MPPIDHPMLTDHATANTTRPPGTTVLDKAFETSVETSELDSALATAQGEFPNPQKNKINPHLKNRYADLTACWDALRPVLAKHKISVTQWPLPSSESNTFLLATRVAHAGQWMYSVLKFPVDKPTAQSYGSALTYAKRYALCAALGISADDDDDGNTASNRATPRAEIWDGKDTRIKESLYLAAKQAGYADAKIAEILKRSVGMNVSDIRARLKPQTPETINTSTNKGDQDAN